MKKKILVSLILAAILALGVGGYAMAFELTKVFSHNLTVTIEPIEVQVEKISNLRVYPDQPVEIVYRITNHSTQTHWNLTAELSIPRGAPSGVGFSHSWTLRGTPYTPGTIFQVPAGATVEMRVITTYNSNLDYAGDIPIEISIYRVSGEPGEG